MILHPNGGTLNIEHRTSSRGLSTGKGWLKLAFSCVIDTIILTSPRMSFSLIGATFYHAAPLVP